MGRKSARVLIAEGAVTVDGAVVDQWDHELTRFERVVARGEIVQAGCERLCIMFYKPAGVLSATKDGDHQTVLDLIDHPEKVSLHLAGRLDRASTGLVILTNDGAWSKMLTRAEKKVPKVYLVEVSEPISPDAVSKFAEGFYFHTEDHTTMPAKLELLDRCRARVTLHEGKYHQIKRMFHRVGNRVVSLHRERVGALVLPDHWQPGDWKLLDLQEIEMTSIAPD